LARNRTEADALRAPTTAGLVSMDEDRITRRVMERMRAMEAEVASLRLSEKGSEGGGGAASLATRDDEGVLLVFLVEHSPCS
jgi:hypothetical protein